MDSNLKPKRFKHILISDEIFQILKRMGNAGDSFNDVLKTILEKNYKLESGSGVESAAKS